MQLITKSGPRKLPAGNGTAELNLGVGKTDNFPVARPFAAGNFDFLADGKRIGGKDC